MSDEGRAAVRHDVEAAADFARRFAEFWRAPSPERLDTVLAERVRLIAPLAPDTETLADGRRVFASLFELIPDLTGEVHRWGATADGVLIEFTLSGSAAGAPVSWDAVDRFTLGPDGLATERVNYFDSMPLALRMGRSPRAWPALMRSRLRPGRSQSSKPA